jgi:hypothetical protein
MWSPDVAGARNSAAGPSSLHITAGIALVDDENVDAEEPLPLGHQQLVQPRGRQSLLAARPPHRVDEHRLHPRGDRVPQGSSAR